ncbi:hypothetical protein AB4037_29840, partial [Labrys sp. KB_33_2]|uniref:hypothetical protein n=1 Tax=Labrys sp. KB_33_2 TaxID=3237479 RepID=UPI003F8DD755
ANGRARMAVLNKADNPIAKILRIAPAHDPPPITVNHKLPSKGIADSSFRSDALDLLSCV